MFVLVRVYKIIVTGHLNPPRLGESWEGDTPWWDSAWDAAVCLESWTILPLMLPEKMVFQTGDRCNHNWHLLLEFHWENSCCGTAQCFSKASRVHQSEGFSLSVHIMILEVKTTLCRSATPEVLEVVLLPFLLSVWYVLLVPFPPLSFLALWNLKTLLPHYHLLPRVLKDSKKCFYVTTSRIGNHRLSPYLLVAFNTDRAACHQMGNARSLELSATICQSWLLRVCLTHFMGCWAMLNKCSVRKVYATELYSGFACYFSKSMLQDGEVLRSSPCQSRTEWLGGRDCV